MGEGPALQALLRGRWANKASASKPPPWMRDHSGFLVEVVAMHLLGVSEASAEDAVAIPVHLDLTEP